MFEAEEEKVTPEETCQRFFTRLAEYLHYHKMPLIKIIKKYVYDAFYNSQDVQLIYVDDFFKSLRE